MGVATTVPGYSHLRKAHYMYGWDWGPQLPDMGIWRPVSLSGVKSARIDNFYLTQVHGENHVTLNVKTEIERFDNSVIIQYVSVHGPEGYQYEKEIKSDASDNNTEIEITIDNPKVWWPNGYGDQPLYEVEVILQKEGKILDAQTRRIGLRTITVSTEPDEWGEEFCFLINGIKIFAMGADYIPTDQIIAHISEEKTRDLLKNCKEANFNHIRVWGGAFYPEDYFYDICDEMGLLIWNDFMFACGIYPLTESFEKNIEMEIIDNIKRIRHHACLALWCGNNEMEVAFLEWGFPVSDKMRSDYLHHYEELIPKLCQKYDPKTYYWPSSPSCGGAFDEPNSYHRGDVHYWDVWHGMKPLTDFRNHYFRFCSEYGFMSLPSIKTVKSFAEEKDLNLFSVVMEAHEKCDDGMKKLLYYMSQMIPYPYSFTGLIYATQLLQADAIRSNVEHMRRNRGRCMGSTYWQLNDSNPVISWAGIDYFGRWKALHYCSKRFYAPILVSVDESNIEKILINISSEKKAAFEGTIYWNLRDSDANILCGDSKPIRAEACSARNYDSLDLSSFLQTKEQRRSRYLEYRLECDGKQVSYGSTLFVMPKHFEFKNPRIKVTIEEETEQFVIYLCAETYAKSICLDLEEMDCLFSDNWFDLHGNTMRTVSVAFSSLSERVALDIFEKRLTVYSCHNLKTVQE